jgi:ribosomal protein S18 acetylase RimI-like enzyme
VPNDGDSGGEARDAQLSPSLDPRSPIPGLQIRQANPDDLEVVLRFRLALLREHAANPMYGRLRADAPERARKLFAAQLTAASEITYLAEAPDGDSGDAPRSAPRAIGILRCIESRGSPLLDPARYGYVASVYVIPEARRHGIVHRLLEAAVEWCDARGLDEIRLHTAVDNESGNAAWSALGFEIVEHLRTRPLHPDR